MVPVCPPVGFPPVAPALRQHTMRRTGLLVVALVVIGVL